MTQRVNSASTPGQDSFLERLPPLLLPKTGWGYFRPGAKPAAVVLILYRRGDAWQVPFVLRRADLPSHPGQIGLPGGVVKAGEDAWEAAVREAGEEISVAEEELVCLGAGEPLYAAVTNFSVVPFVAWMSQDDPRLIPQISELQGIVEVPLDRLLESDAWVEGDQPVPGRYLPVEEGFIWGLTARLLADLLPRIEAARPGEVRGA